MEPGTPLVKNPFQKPTNLNKAYAWFDGLDFDAVRSGGFVELESPKEKTNQYGFVVATSGHAQNVLTLDLQHFRHGKSERGFATSKPVNFKEFAAKELKSESSFLRNDGVASYVMARACDARKLPELEKGFQAKGALKEKDLQEAIAKGQINEADISFRNEATPWETHLKEFRRVVWLFPNSSVVRRAQESIDILKQVLEEQQAGDQMLSKVGKLIRGLPEVRGSASKTQEISDITGPPAKDLVDLSFEAVPDLIAVISDRRFTRCSDGGNGPFYVLRVGDAALQILDKIAGKHIAGKPMTAPMTVAEIPTLREKAKTWWKAAQTTGELPLLLARIKKGPPDSQVALEILQARFPGQASRLMGTVMSQSKNPNAEGALIVALAKRADPEAIAILKEKTKSGSSMMMREMAAFQLLSLDPTFAGKALLSDWQELGDTRNWKTEPYVSDYVSFEGFSIVSILLFRQLAGIVDTFAKGFSEKPLDFRSMTVEAMTRVGNNPPPGLEDFLIYELDDEGPGQHFYIDRQDLDGPVIGEVAALGLSKIDPNRYHFKKFPFHDDGAKERAEFKNIWRASQKLPPLPLPASPSPSLLSHAGDKVVKVQIKHETAAAPSLVAQVKGLNSKQLTIAKLNSLLTAFGKSKRPAFHCFYLELRRNSPGEGVTMMVDFDQIRSRTRGYYVQAGLEGKYLLNAYSAEPYNPAFLISDGQPITKCLKSKTTQAFDVRFIICTSPSPDWSTPSNSHIEKSAVLTRQLKGPELGSGHRKGRESL